MHFSMFVLFYTVTTTHALFIIIIIIISIIVILHKTNSRISLAIIFVYNK